MILYSTGKYHFSFVWRLQGSAIPRALLLSFPSFCMAVFWRYIFDACPNQLTFLSSVKHTSAWSATTFVIAFLLTFRVGTAYRRYWEGITLVQKMRAEWFETCSSLMAFSKVAIRSQPKNAEIIEKVTDFQYTLIRLMSLMHGFALRQIGGGEEEYAVIDVEGLDAESLEYLAQCEVKEINRVEVLLHWIEVLITDSMQDGILAVPPPILTRVYQTISRGTVNLQDARKLADIPFPFPISQLNVVLLWVHCFITPAFAAAIIKNAFVAAFVSCLLIVGMWSAVLIAGQLEHPFGTDVNDLPLSVLQFDMNNSLLMLLDPEPSRPPWLQEAAHRDVTMLRRTLGQPGSSTSTSSRRLMRPSGNEGRNYGDSTFQLARMSLSHHKVLLRKQRAMRNTVMKSTAQGNAERQSFGTASSEVTRLQHCSSGLSSYGDVTPSRTQRESEALVFSAEQFQCGALGALTNFKRETSPSSNCSVPGGRPVERTAECIQESSWDVPQEIAMTPGDVRLPFSLRGCSWKKQAENVILSGQHKDYSSNDGPSSVSDQNVDTIDHLSFPPVSTAPLR